jgi:hypothetical protein
MSTQRKRKRHLQQHTRRNGKQQPLPDGAIELLPASGACSQCGGNTLSHQPAPLTPIYLLSTPIPPPTHHPRGLALVHLRIVEITLIILLVLGCCTLVVPKMRMVLEEWHKFQGSSNAHASLAPTKNNEAPSPSVPNPNFALRPITTGHNATTFNGFERKQDKKTRVVKRRRGKRSVLCLGGRVRGSSIRFQLKIAMGRTRLDQTSPDD